MNQDPSGRTNKELDDEIDQIVDATQEAPSSYSWIDEYTESRIPTLETRRRPRKTSRKAARKTKKSVVKSKTRIKAKTKARKTRPRTAKTRTTKKRAAKRTAKKRGADKARKTSRKIKGRAKAKKRPRGKASIAAASPDRTGPSWMTHVDPLVAVTNSVRSMPVSGRFGHKVFISAIWDRIGKKIGMDLPTFKEWLLDQNRRGNLTLARADLVGAMDPALVRESEIWDRGATFHFVLDKEALNRSGWGGDWR